MMGDFHQDAITRARAYNKANAKRLSEKSQSIFKDAVSLNQKSGIANGSQPGLFIDDLNIVDSLKSPIPLVPVRFGDTNDHANDLAKGTTASADAGPKLYSALIDQIYGPQYQYMMEITLEIRGDPFWLGTPVSNSYTTDAPDAPYATFDLGENVFIFRFNVPYGFDETTGGVILTSENMYTGFYRVFKVEHKFKDGALVQVLQGKRVPGVDLTKMILQESNSFLDTGTTVGNPIG
jgi:hypothetical protein